MQRALRVSYWGGGRRIVVSRGFTLIELLVVVAIIALLLAVLLPSLNRAKEQARAAKCAANLSSVGKAVHTFLAENKATFPLSYAYAYNASGDVDMYKQPENRDFGYVHWSWAIFDRGQVDDNAFTCPTIPNKGHPRTFPGSDREDWENDQVDHAGNPPPGSLNESRVADRQARRMAYTANAAIMPRNKGPVIGNIEPGAERSNRYVKESEIEDSGRTILATEFNRNWQVLSTGGSGGWISKSHRPISPLYSTYGNGGYEATQVPLNPANIREKFRYTRDPFDKNLDLKTLAEIEDDGYGHADEGDYNPMNFIGRHHPGGDKFGGTANFLFVDGHAVRKAVHDTVRSRLWGKKFYGVVGNDTNIEFYGNLP